MKLLNDMLKTQKLEVENKNPILISFIANRIVAEAVICQLRKEGYSLQDLLNAALLCYLADRTMQEVLNDQK